MKRRKIQHQDILLCSIVAVLLICISINTMVGVLSRSINLRFDMTDNKLYHLSDTTKEILQSTEKATQIIVCSSKEEFWIVGVELLERYQALSDKLSVAYVDPYTQPMLMESYRGKGVDLEQSDILIEQGENFQVIALNQLYTADATGKNIQNIRAEQVITSAIYTMETKKNETVLFAAGHNETPTKSLYSVFTENGITISVQGETFLYTEQENRFKALFAIPIQSRLELDSTATQVPVLTIQYYYKNGVIDLITLYETENENQFAVESNGASHFTTFASTLEKLRRTVG